MQTVTKFIVALAPSHPLYLGCPKALPERAKIVDGDPAQAVLGLVTDRREQAKVFDTFEAAQAEADTYTRWGGTQRVEQIAVQVAEPRDLDGSDLNIDTNRIEARDAATFAWHEAVDAGKETVAERIDHVLVSMRDLGFGADRATGAKWLSAGVGSDDVITIEDPRGNWLVLNFDPGQDGFDYPDSADDAEAIEARLDAEANLGEGEESEPADAAEDGDLLAVAAATAESLSEQVRLSAHPEELVETLTDLLTDLRLACLAHGIDFATALRRSEMHAEAETVACDGCTVRWPEACTTLCGNAEVGEFRYCDACRKQAEDSPRA